MAQTVMAAATSSLSLDRLSKPRQTVYSATQSDTVAELSDLPTLDAQAFFAETHLTEGMIVLLRQVFERLMGRSDQGLFRLKQAMGGGKTHNLIAAGLLAREPSERRGILGRIGVAADDRPVRVAAFSGRETDSPDYLWVTLFRLLGCEHRWQRSAEVPGPTTWARVIGDEPALILLDELPPFFVNLGSKAAGPGTTEADRLALALANLMNAIVSGRLPNTCLVISDLAGAWGDGSVRIQQAIDNATQEISRGALDIIPVRLDSTELYAILRARLFKTIPDEPDRRAVGQAYAAAYRTAVQQGVMPGSFERWAHEVPDSYPFHPGLHELFARFRENQGFQQTREMLRLGRRMVADLWTTGGAQRAMLIHPHALALADPDVAATLERINPSLTNARSRDVADAQHNAIAEVLAREPGAETASDSAKLLYLASLAIGPHALQGLTPEEIAAYLCAPDRDVSSANIGLVTRLEEASWYLHRRTDGRWHYRNVKNVSSAIRDRAELMNPDARRKEVEAYLRKTFDPNATTPQRSADRRTAYQKLLVFPTIEDIRSALGPNEVLLVVSQPTHAGLSSDLKAFWDNETWRNRLMFLSGSETFTQASTTAAYLKAAEDQLAEFVAQRMGETQPEMQQAKAAVDSYRGRFHSALRETFTQLYFPDISSGRLEGTGLKLDFAENAFVGQLAILDTLTDQRKLRTDVESDGLRTEFETFVFTAQEATWRDLLETAARKPEWYFLPPGGHENMKTAAFRKDVWRDQGAGYIRKGPFPRDKTSVLVTRIARDEATGRVTFSVSAKHGDRVHFEEGGSPATINSPVVHNGRHETTALLVSFLAVDSTGEHETGDPRAEANSITLKYDTMYRDGARRVTLKAIPTGTIRYTLDGSNPRNGGVCHGGEIVVPAGPKLLLAIAEAEGIWSEQLRVPLPEAGGGDNNQPFRPDLHRAATWRHPLSTSDRGRAFRILECLKRHRGTALGGDITVTRQDDADAYLSVAFGPSIQRSADELETMATDLINQIIGAGAAVDLSLRIDGTRFESGTALVEAAKELEEPLEASEVRQ
jgi:hypothetical protein